jgi:hypothetical protein
VKIRRFLDRHFSHVVPLKTLINKGGKQSSLYASEVIVAYIPDVMYDIIIKGFETCSQEFRGIMSFARRPHRTLIHFIDITNDSGEDVAEVFVPGWKRHHAVRFPVSQIPDDLLARVKRQLDNNQDSWLIARVNTEAEKSEDLYFTLFESAPELDDNDGLA